MDLKNIKHYLERSNALQRVGGYVILKDGIYAGKALVVYPTDGASKLQVNLFCPHAGIQYGKASGYGYNKLNAAMSGLIFDGYEIQYNSSRWDQQLEDLGYQVIQIC
jgi:hypothetical protein